ncbi:MAG: hypothetical protein M1836_002601 [Candelina mexicana]|nr:MAG: hypothetical protein M1836_002601 [Candelina mexicana]
MEAPFSTAESSSHLRKLACSRPPESGSPYRTLEEKLAEYFPHANVDNLEGGDGIQYSETVIYGISDLLRHVDETWSRSPRLYIILRLIDQLELFNELIHQGITDFWFPFTPASLPRVVRPAVRNDFLANQWMVLTKAIDLEKGEDGEHRYFADGEPLPFERKAVLGQGGFSQVDKVLSRISHKEYARKLIHRASRSFEGRKQRMESFEKELKILKALKHHHIVELIGSYTDSRFIGLIMSPVADCDLAAFFNIVPESENSRSLLRSYYGCLASALVYLHTSKIRHKDIKPQNILVKGDNVLLTDFGISLDWQDLGGGTTTGETPKSPRYCAPEVADYQPRNESSDIWSLGCVFLEIATVLKGRTIDDMKSCFENVGERSQFYRSNPSAITRWLDTIKGDRLAIDNTPFEWIQAMLQHDRKLRPDALMVIADIRASAFSSSNAVFCGICCSIDDGLRTITDSVEEGMAMDFGRTLVEVATEDQVINADFLLDSVKSIPDKKGDDRIKRDVVAESRKVKHDRTSRSKEPSFVAPIHLSADKNPRPHSSALVKAMIERDEEQVKVLLQDDADIMAREKDGSTPLHWAVRLDLDYTVEALLGKGASASAADNDGRAPLSWAAEYGRWSPAVRLMLCGVDHEAKDQTGRTALLWAAQMGQAKMVQFLLTKGADPNSIDVDGVSPLSHAACTVSDGQLATMQVLLQHPLIKTNSSDMQGLTPLALATSRGHVEAVELLLRHKDVNPDPRDKTGATPLAYAALAERLDIMRPLLARGANPNVKAEFKGGKTLGRDNLLSWAAARDRSEIVQLLLNCKNIDPNHATQGNGNPLHWAAIMGSVKSAKLLISMESIDLNKTDPGGYTALSWAAARGHLDVVKLLVETGLARTEIKDVSQGRTPLAWAAIEGHSEVVRLLLDHGALASAKDKRNETPLMLARNHRRWNVVRLLEEYQQNVSRLSEISIVTL